MTDITNTAPITFRPWFLLRMKFPKWAPKWRRLRLGQFL